MLDAVDELHKPLEELAVMLELFLHERVQINSYSVCTRRAASTFTETTTTCLSFKWRGASVGASTA